MAVQKFQKNTEHIEFFDFVLIYIHKCNLCLSIITLNSILSYISLKSLKVHNMHAY